MGKLETKISRTLSLVLRHDPASVGLTLDGNGWAKVDDLLASLKKKSKGLDRTLLEKVVTENAQQRFSFSEDGQSIRANEGHSVQIDIKSTEQSPPEYLYHGTDKLHMDEIEISGLLKGKQQHVHLYEDPRDAHANSQRHKHPVILEVASRLMESHDFKLYRTEIGDWLTEEVPPDYLNRQFKI